MCCCQAICTALYIMLPHVMPALHALPQEVIRPSKVAFAANVIQTFVMHLW